MKKKSKRARGIAITRDTAELLHILHRLEIVNQEACKLILGLELYASKEADKSQFDAKFKSHIDAAEGWLREIIDGRIDENIGRRGETTI